MPAGHLPHHQEILNIQGSVNQHQDLIRYGVQRCRMEQLLHNMNQVQDLVFGGQIEKLASLMFRVIVARFLGMLSIDGGSHIG